MKNICQVSKHPEKSLESSIRELKKRLRDEMIKKTVALNYIKSAGKGREFAKFCEGPEGIDALLG